MEATNEGAVNQDYLSLMANIGIIPYAEKGDVGNKKPDDLTKCKLVSKGDLVINSMNYAIGSYGMSAYEGVCSPVYLVLRARENALLRRFALRVFENKYFQKYVASLGNGILEYRAAIGWDDIKGINILLPSKTVQKAILDYVDEATRKIDRLVAMRRRQMELLKEQRAALIQQAVTRGLDPKAPLKDSGLPWLGPIPKHWEVKRLKYLCSLLRDGTHQPPKRVEVGYPLLSVRNIQDGIFVRRNDDSMISEEDFRTLNLSFAVEVGDLLMAIVGATLGKVAIVPNIDSFQIQRSLAILRPRLEVVNRDFLRFLIECQAFQKCLWSNVGFSAQPGIYLSTVGNLGCPLPSLEEQARILEFIQYESQRVDRLIFAYARQIEMLMEYRAALIHEAVTGQKAV